MPTTHKRRKVESQAPNKKYRFIKRFIVSLVFIISLIIALYSLINTKTVYMDRADASQPSIPPYKTYIIAGNVDTVYAIWQNHGTGRWDEFMYEVEQHNPEIRNIGTVQVGMELRVPRELVE